MDGQFEYDYDFFEQYLNGQVSDGLRADFEKKLSTDKALSDQFEFYKSNVYISSAESQSHLRPNSIKNLKAEPQKLQRLKLIFYTIAAVLIITPFLFLLYTGPESKLEKAASLTLEELKLKERPWKGNYDKYIDSPENPEMTKYVKGVKMEYDGILKILNQIALGNFETAKTSYDKLFPNGYPENKLINSIARNLLILKYNEKRDRAIHFFKDLSTNSNASFYEVGRHISKSR